ncbi:MAG: hypothetical protein L6Q54_11400 [Leptospiraceae bacterium]|nr:hypothetical protein [Leptospiraceae bacterium]MCK6381833.1 hypothetical protein [Leptospiraceae bacterium]
MKKNSFQQKSRSGFRHVFFVFIILSILIFSLFSGERLFSETNPSLKERKKSFEKKVKLIEEIQSIFPEENLTQKKDKLEKSANELSEIYKRGNERERREAITKAEITLLETQRVFVEYLSNTSKELIHKISMTKSYADAHREEVKETRNSLEKKEKAAKYFTMAKEEYNTAEKFFRDGNLSYALHIYKRSIRYSLSSIKTIGASTEKKFEHASDKWVFLNSKVVVNP